MVYDKADRLVLTQDANMKAQNNWLMTKYDRLGRVAYTGLINAGGERINLQNLINDLIITESRDATGFTKNGMNIYYSNTYFTSNITSILSINYYDTYPSYSFNPSFPSTILGNTVITDNPTNNGGISTKSLPVMSLVKNIEDDNWTKNYTYYDTKGRAIGAHSINHLGGYTKTESELDFTGVPQKTNTYHLRKTGEAGITVKERFVYDSQNRLLKHYHQVDSKPEELLAENTYNELSQLTNKKVGNNLQNIDYAYNIRGWMTEINKDQMALPDLGGKLFSYKIKYNQKEGIDNPDPTQFAGKNVKAKYNGNIAEVDWRAIETLGANPSLTPKRYGYAYDNLNRLTAGYYQNPNNPYSKENTESLAYDLNGNITNLYRTSVLESPSNTANVIDNLQYIYAGGDNKLTSINDNSQNPTGYEGGGSTIDYDLNGSMVAMPDKGISSIKYNFLNLPNNLNLSKNGSENLTINTKYRADGTKLAKENTTTIAGFSGYTTTRKTTDYLDGFQYLKTENIGGGGSSEMLMASSLSQKAMQPLAFSLDEKRVPPPAKTPDLQFFPTSEGFYDYVKDQYIYQYKDHLGNNRISFGRDSGGNLEIVDANDYYPFGMNHLKSGNAFFGQSSYKNYKYNGKELQESGMYDYGARFYMPDLGRWGVIDPLAEMYRRHSPYNYTVNNPINFTDPDGRWVRGAGFFNNLFNSDAKIHAEQAAERKNPQTGHYGTGVTKGDKKGTWEVTYNTSNFSYTDTYGSKGLISSLAIGSAEGGGYGAVAPGTTAVDPWGSTIDSTPESRGKTDIQTMVSENPLVQGAVIDAITGGIGAKLLGKLFPAVKAEATVLEGAVESNFNRFVSKVPANSKASASYELLEDGNYLFQATSPGKVPGSSALYQKWVNPQGETFKMLKTTFAPDGSIIHVKPK
jgi:RHS repeat-associated protein